MDLPTAKDFRDEFSEYNADIIDDKKLARLFKEAENTINYHVFNKLDSALSAFAEKLLKQAIIYGALHIFLTTNTAGDSTNDQNFTTVKLGDFTVSKNTVHQLLKDANSNNKLVRMLGSQAYQYIARSGLLYPGLDPLVKVEFANRVDDD
jgi:hypothetical protein